MNDSFEEAHTAKCSKPDYCLHCDMEQEQDMLCGSGLLLEDDLDSQKYPFLTTQEREQKIKTILSLIMRDPQPNCDRGF